MPSKKMKRIPTLLFVLTIGAAHCQSNDRIISFADMYGQIRYFHPNKISDSEWRSFLYNSLDHLFDQDSLNEGLFFNRLFEPISNQILFSDSTIPKKEEEPISDPVYWQHQSFGASDGIYYKSIIVNYDTIKLLSNVINYETRINKISDSLEIVFELKPNSGELNVNASVEVFSWGWKSNEQIELHKTLQFDAKRKVYFVRLTERTEDVYFRFYLEGKSGIQLNMEKLSVIRYFEGERDSLCTEDFLSTKIHDDLTLGDHHSTNLTIEQGMLSVSANSDDTFFQIYPSTTSNRMDYEGKLANGLNYSFPLIIDRSSVKSEIKELVKIHDKTAYAKIAKSGLIESYCRMIHFNPNLKFVDINLEHLLIECYHLADNCQSLDDVRKLIVRFHSPFYDGHAYVYNSQIERDGKCLGITIKFSKGKCWVIYSEEPEFQVGDRITKINGISPKKSFFDLVETILGSRNSRKATAELYFLCEDSDKINNISYKRGIKKRSYSRKYGSLTPPSNNGNGIGIEEVDSNIYLFNLSVCTEVELEDFFKTEPNLKGAILDGRYGIRLQSNVLRFFTPDSLHYPLVYTPLYQLPFQDSAHFKMSNVNAYIVGKSKTSIPIMLLTANRNKSSEETFVSLARQIEGIKLIGETTSGCNGMVNTYVSAGGFEYRFTASIVNKMDGSVLYNEGYIPDKKISIKRKQFRKGYDPYIRASVNYIERKQTRQKQAN